MKLFKDVLKRNLPALLLWLCVTAVNLCVFLLYDIFTEPLIYSSVLGLFLLAAFLTAQYFRARKKAKERADAAAGILADRSLLPAPETLAEADYRQMIETLGNRIEALTAEFDAERRDALDYYTSWVHQIKTPIAVMKLKLTEDTPEHRALSAELFRIEQYADMVLQYIRLGSGTNDLVVRKYALDGLINETVRKYAAQFVGKKLKLSYTPCGDTVVTDRKWFCCILEQFISNALKYTFTGGIGISAADGVLTVSDTGIGIAPEDLPRIFEKGYTGANGRIGEQSSGLGLYLAKRAADLLSLTLTAESSPGKGSRFGVVFRPENK